MRKISHTYLEEKTVQGLVSVFLILCALYCVLLISIIFSVIERKQNTLAVNNLTNQLMETEGRYAAIIASLDDSKLRELGFGKFSATSFAVRKDPIASYAILYGR